jgi:hypothetical protein
VTHPCCTRGSSAASKRLAVLPGAKVSFGKNVELISSSKVPTIHTSSGPFAEIASRLLFSPSLLGCGTVTRFQVVPFAGPDDDGRADRDGSTDSGEKHGLPFRPHGATAGCSLQTRSD